jgi:hypothetical protein
MLVRHRVTHRVLTSSWSKTRVLVEVTQSDRCSGHFYFWVIALGAKLLLTSTALASDWVLGAAYDWIESARYAPRTSADDPG